MKNVHPNWKEKTFSVLLALLVWQITAMVIHQRVLLVSPVAVFLRLLTLWQEPGFLPSLWFSFYHIAAGFLLGAALGILLAFAAARFHLVETLLWPWMASIKTIPVASFVVICLIWLSSRSLSIFIAFLVVFPMIYQNILTGLKNCSKQMDEMARVFQLPWYRRLRYILIPQLKSYLLSACNVSIGMAWKAGVAAEIIGIPRNSLGERLYMSKIYLDTDDLLAWTVVIVAASVITEKVVLAILRKALGAKVEEK